MKKIFEKIVSITLLVVSMLFVALMLLVMFKPEYAESLNDKLVKVLIIVFTGFFVILSGLNIYGAFANNDKLSAVLLFKGKENATKATVRVVKKWVKKAAKQVEGAKVTKVLLFVNENNDVSMKATLKVASAENVVNIVTRTKLAVKDAMFNVLGLQFSAIDFILSGVKRDYKADASVLAVDAAREVEQINAAQEARRTEIEEKEAEIVAERKESGAETAEGKEEVSTPENEVLAAETTDNTTEEINGEEKQEVSEAEDDVAPLESISENTDEEHIDNN